MKDPRLCHCDLADEIFLIDGKDRTTHCEVCRVSEANPCSLKSIEQALKFYRDRVGDLLRKVHS